MIRSSHVPSPHPHLRHHHRDGRRSPPRALRAAHRHAAPHAGCRPTGRPRRLQHRPGAVRPPLRRLRHLHQPNPAHVCHPQGLAPHPYQHHRALHQNHHATGRETRHLYPHHHPASPHPHRRPTPPPPRNRRQMPCWADFAGEYGY